MFKEEKIYLGIEFYKWWKYFIYKCLDNVFNVILGISLKIMFSYILFYEVKVINFVIFIKSKGV